MRIIHTTILVACWLSPGHAQGIRLYDRGKDDAAQKALDAAKKLASGSLFDAELKNLDAFVKLEVDSTFEGEARVRSNFLNQIAVGTWGGVDILISSLKAQLDPKTIDTRIADLRAERDRLQVQRDKVNAQKPAPGPALPANPAESIAEIVSQGIDLDNAAASIAGGLKSPNAEGQQAIDLIGKALGESKTAVDAASANQKTVTDTAKQLQQLRSSLNSLAADRVKIELDHLKTLLKIWERAGDDIKQTQGLIDEYASQSAGIDARTTILDTVRSRAAAARNAAPEDLRARRNELDAVVRRALLAAAIAARWNSAGLIAQLREAHEIHQYSIQRSRLEAHALEVAVGSGAQRLAMFYKGGVRPEIIAQILYTAATASISGAIAATK